MDLTRLVGVEEFEAWVEFDEDCEVLIAYVPRDELQALSKKATKVGFKRHQRSDELDSTEADRLLGRRAVKNWRALPGKAGFTSQGQPFPYTPENCDLLMAKFHDFSRFVNETCVDFDRLVEAEKAAQRKNLLTTSGQE